MTSLSTSSKEQSSAYSRNFSFYEKAVGMLLAAGAAAPAANATIVHWEGSGVRDTGNLAPSGSTVGLEIGTQFGSGAYGFVQGIGALSLPSDSLAGFFREATAPTVGLVGGEFDPPGGKLVFAVSSTGASPSHNATFSNDNLFAFSFTSGAVNGGSAVYGWAQLDAPSSDPFAGATIVAWAYDDTGASIQLGAIPEPSNIALLAAGAVGGIACFHRHRNRRKRQPAA